MILSIRDDPVSAPHSQLSFRGAGAGMWFAFVASLAAPLSEAEQVTKVHSMLKRATGDCTRGCTTTEKLHWWGAGIGDAGCNALATHLAAAPPTKQSVKNVLLGGNGVGDACMASLSRAATSGALQSVTAMGLSRNNIGDEGVKLLAAALSSGGLGPQDLYISTNRVGSAGAVALAAALAGERSGGSSALQRLKRLSLGDNRVGDEGAIALARALQAGRQSRLRLLNLSNNSLGDAAASALAVALSADGALSGSLEELALTNNRIGDAGLRALAAAVGERGGTRLRELALRGNAHTPGGAAELELRRVCEARRIRLKL